MNTTQDHPPLDIAKLAREHARAIEILRDICWSGTTLEIDDERYRAGKKFLESIHAWHRP